MDDKQFFEELSAKSTDQEQDVEVDLVKSGAATAKRSSIAADEGTEANDGELVVDAYQTANHIIIEVPIAGVSADDLDVSITPETVTITGKRERTQHVRSEDYVYQECYWGKFSRSIVLPQEIDAEGADASLKNGVLTIKLPKLNRTKSKKLKVKGE
jgi:HSP20 family protein